MPYTILLVLCFFLNNSFAAIYESVDKDGHTIFSDQASSSAKIVPVAEPSLISFTQTPTVNQQSGQMHSVEQAPKGSVSTKLLIHIVEPKNEATIFYTGQPLRVIATITKPLTEMQTAILLLDGKSLQTIPGPSKNTQMVFMVSRLVNGPHTLQVDLNQAGKRLASSSSISITYHQFRPRTLPK